MHQATVRREIAQVQGHIFLVKIQVEQHGYSIVKNAASSAQRSIKGKDSKPAHFSLKLSQAGKEQANKDTAAQRENHKQRRHLWYNPILQDSLSQQERN